MRRLLLACLALAVWTGAGYPAEWRLQKIDTPARVNAIETVADQARINAGGLWYTITIENGRATLKFIETPAKEKRPEGALPDGRIVHGSRDIARAWFAEATDRYDHGILGDKTESSALVIEDAGGKRATLRLKDDAVFEDLEPRLADLNGDGHDEIVVVKSYLKRGSALAVIGLRKGKYEVLAETPPLGAPHRWLAPAGIADFDGDGKIDIALVRQPHVIGDLELWSWKDNNLNKTAMLPDTANHIIGTRALDMAAVADFDGDGIADIAVPSLDRNRLRIVSFAPQPREIASTPLPAKAISNLALVGGASAPPALALGLADGSLVLLQKPQ